MGLQNSCCVGNCTEAPQRVHGTQPPSVQRRKIPDFARDSFSFPPPPLPTTTTKRLCGCASAKITSLCHQLREVPSQGG